MGALRQPKLGTSTPRSPRKTPGTADFAENFGRDPKSASEKLRTSVRAWAGKRAGFAPIPRHIMADLPRLSSGHLEDMLVLTVIMESWGRPRDTGESMPDWTPVLDVRELAQRCTGALNQKDMDAAVRSVQRLLSDMAPQSEDNPRGRGMIEVKREEKWRDRGKVSIRLRWEEWQKLPDYREWLELHRPAAVDESEDGEDTEEGETAGVVKGDVFLAKKPQTIRPGGTKTLKVECGVKEFEFRNPLAIDLTIHPVVQSGRLVLAPLVADEQNAKNTNFSGARPNGINKNTPSRRHGCRHEEAELGVDPKAEMLCRVFDERLQASGAPLLSYDKRALSSAVDALGEMPEAALLQFLSKRSSKKIARPLSVPAIVTEARQNWKRAEQQVEDSTERCWNCKQPAGVLINGACVECAEQIRQNQKGGRDVE